MDTSAILWLSVLLWTIGAAFRPKWALMILPVLLPMALLRLSLRGIPFSFLEVAVEALFVIFCYRWAIKGGKTFLQKVFKPFFQWGSIPQLLLLLFLGALLTWTVVPSEVVFNTGIKEHLFETYETRRIWLGIMKGWMVPMLLYGVMLYHTIQTKEERDTALSWAVIGALVLGVVSMVSRFVLGIPDTLDGRLGGLYVSANYLVFLIAPAFVWSTGQVFQWWAGKNHLLEWQRWVCLVAVPVLGVVLILARSYASWIVIAFLLLIVAFTYLRGWKLLLLGLLGLFLGVGVLSTEAGSEKLRGFFTVDDQSSTSTRVEVYTISAELIKRHWITGIGPGQYESQYITNAHDILGKTPYEWVMLHPHNIYISMWLGTGLLGLIAFLAMSVVALWRAYKEKALLAALPLLYLLLHGMVDTPFWKLDSMLLFILVLVCAGLPKKKN